jgi:hypothetical protein
MVAPGTRSIDKSISLLGDLYVLKKTLNYPQLNCQPGVSKLRVVEKYMPKVEGW